MDRIQSTLLREAYTPLLHTHTHTHTHTHPYPPPNTHTHMLSAH